MTHDSSDLIAQLKQACNNLLWISESEYPFEAFCWQNQTASDLTHEKLLDFTHHSTDTIVKTDDFDSFFEVVTQPQDWYGDEEIATMKQYQQLVATLKQRLNNLKVYRLGEINLDIYIVGQTPDSHLAGIATKAVET
jgi:hypothetical protein